MSEIENNNDEPIVLRSGDIYYWSYRETGDDGQWGRYHCCSRIAIVDEHGRLRDTFWSHSGDGRVFGADDLHSLALIFVANLDDLEKRREYEADYYDDADIVNLNHSNSSSENFYIRKGAKRSAAKMLEVARRRLAQAQADEATAIRRAKELREKIARIEAGHTDTHL